ncbi:MAG: PAS domain S-box protein [Dechloromonas sp.]|nr:PAS domain S-box protein [Dechloromonas sp.]
MTQQLNSLVMTTAAPPPAECYMPSDAAALHHLVCDFMVDAVVVVDPEGCIALTNPAFSRLFGFSADEVLGRTIDFLSADKADSLRSGKKQLQGHAADLPGASEVRCRRRDGSEFWSESLVTQIATADGSFSGTLYRHRDVSARKATEVALRQSEAEFRSMFEFSVLGSAQTDPTTGRILRVNRKFCEITGYAADELLAMTLRDITHPDDRESNWQGFRATMDGNADVYVVDKRYVRKDGSVVWVNVQLAPLRDEQGHPIRSNAVVQDVTMQKQAEAALRQQLELQDWLSKIAATVPGVICSFQLRPDGSACFPYASAALADLYGIPPEAVREDAMALFERIHPDDLAHVNATIAHSAATMSPWRDEFRVRHPDKGEQWVDGHSMPQREADGSILWHGYLADITARKRMEQALRDNEADLRRAQAVAQTGSWRLNVQKNELLWSDENHRIFGIAKGTPLTYETFLSIAHPDDKAFVDRSWAAALHGVPYDIEHRIVVAGETRWVRERAELEFDAQGKLLGGFGSTQDITERKRAEAALSASESRFRLAMEAVAGVVYDWDRQSDTTYWSSGLGRIFGVSGLDAESGRSWWRDNVHPEDLARIRHEIFRDLKVRSGQMQLEYRMRHSAGYWLHIADCVHIVRDALGRTERVVGSLTDISLRKSAEASLRRINDSLELKVAQCTAEAEVRALALLESERFARLTIDALNFALCVLDANGRIIAVNKAWRECAEANGGDGSRVCEGASYLDVCDAAARNANPVAAQVASAIRAALAGGDQNFSIEYEWHTPAERRWYVMRLCGFPGDGPLRLVIKHENITERKLAAEEQAESARRLKRLAAHLETVREEQSATIAREVHDELGGTLTMVKLGLATVAGSLTAAEAQQASIQRILGQLDDALQTVKRISANLRPATLDTLGLVATIRWHAAQFSQLTGIATELRLPEYIRLSRKRSTAIFRIVQEALTNVAKHAGASRAFITLRKHRGYLNVEISDDGVGLAASRQLKRDSFGLIGMHERAQYLGGQLSITGLPGAGTCLSLRIPLEDSKEHRKPKDEADIDCR